MVHMQQPTKNSCGQTCVAIVAHQPFENVRLLIGIGATSEHDLRIALKVFGFTLGRFGRTTVKITTPARWSKDCDLKHPVIARLRSKWDKHGYHWIVINRDIVHDPSLPEPQSLESYLDNRALVGHYITSAATVIPR